MWEYPPVHKSFTKMIPHNSLHPQPVLRFSCPLECCKDGLCNSENVATPVPHHHSHHLRAWHLLRSLDPQQEKLGLINRRLKSQNNCALDSQNGFGLGLAGGAIWHYGKYVPKQCPWGEWQPECVMGYCGFKQRSVWLGVEIRAYCVPLSKQSYNGLLRLLTSNKQCSLCKHDILKPWSPRHVCLLSYVFLSTHFM